MFYWMKPLPEADIDYEKYKPFISNNWFRQNFMYFVYLLQAMLVTLSILFGVWKFSNKKPLNSRRQKIIAEMRDNPNITTAELHNILGVSETAVENNISFLRENEYIERVGSKKAGYWKVL